jgi:tight adherence protein B
MTLALLGLRPRGRTLQQRLKGFIAPPDSTEAKTWSGTLTNRVFVEAEKSLEQARWWASFKEELEVGLIQTPAVQIVTLTALGTLLAAGLLLQISGSAVVAVVALGLPLAVRGVLKRKLEKQRKLFAEQLADNLSVIASAMRAGHSFAGALSVAGDDAPEPARSEFRRVMADEKLAIPLEDSLSVVVRRMQSRDLEQVVLVAALQREAGGNTAEVIDRVAETVRQRSELQRMVQTLTAQGRMSRWVVSFIPVALLGIVTLMNPDYMAPTFETGTGRMLLTLAGIMVVVGSLVIKKIVNIKV